MYRKRYIELHADYVYNHDGKVGERGEKKIKIQSVRKIKSPLIFILEFNNLMYLFLLSFLLLHSSPFV
jgi:hypothetical protein